MNGTPAFDGGVAAEQVSATLWRLSRSLRYTDAAGRLYTVPAGFVTDWASTPRLLWPLFPPSGKHTRAAVLHDLTLDSAIFLEAMRACGCLWLPRHLMWLGVVVYGALPWVRARRARDGRG